MNEDELEKEFQKAVAEFFNDDVPSRVIDVIDERKLMGLLEKVYDAADLASSDRKRYTQEEADLFKAGVELVITSIAIAADSGKLDK